MIILAKNDYSKIRLLYSIYGKQFPVISSVIDGSQNGIIIVDSFSEPCSAMIIHNSGFSLFTGDKNNFRFIESLSSEMADPAFLGSRYILLYDAPEELVSRLEKDANTIIRKRGRIRFSFDMNRPVCGNDTLPSNSALHDISAENLAAVEHLGLDIGTRFWKSPQNFLEKGYGTCLFYEKEPVCVCYACAVSGNLAETDVFCKESFRNRRFSTITANRFVADSLKRGITPLWDCFSDNTASVSLAEKCGFSIQYKYDLHSFNIPFKQKAEI
jgi:hypothetical protein